MRCKSVVRDVGLVTLFMLTSIVGISQAFAQSSEGAEAVPTSTQLDLNEAGVRAIIAEDYELAVKMFDSSLALGPFNITYVNRGRALQHAGQCELADQSYEAAYSAPAISEPSPADVAATIERYRAELREVCPGKVMLECDPVTLEVSIDGKSLGTCPTEPIELSKGEHIVLATSMGKSLETVVEIVPLKLRRLSLRLDTSGEGTAGVGALEPLDSVRPLALEESVSSGSSGAGYWFLSGGAALLAGGVMLDNFPESASNSKYDHLDVVPVGMYVGAGLLVIYGVNLLLN